MASHLKYFIIILIIFQINFFLVTNREILDNNMRFIYIFENVYICVLPVHGARARARARVCVCVCVCVCVWGGYATISSKSTF